MTRTFEPPPFHPHRWIRGGHLHTLWHFRSGSVPASMAVPHFVKLSGGDAIVLHDDCPSSWMPGDLAALLIHGLSGCHQSPYIVRLASTLNAMGIRTFRMDMRGAGAARTLSSNITHAGRSDDVLAAIAAMGEHAPGSPLAAVGISLGGNQLLRAVGRVGAGIDLPPVGWERVRCCAAVSPPIDLAKCSERMQHWSLRPYNRHFIRHLLENVPPQVATRVDFQRAIERGRPRTLREFDARITAPLGGFDDAMHYYREASATYVLPSIEVPTLVLAANDDPIVPAGCFQEAATRAAQACLICATPAGGHVGFVDRYGGSWMDQTLAAWISRFQ